MIGIQKILHPTDFSENSRYAFEAACALSRENHATLVALHVMMPSAAPFLEEPPPDPMQTSEAQQPHARFPWPQSADPEVRVEHRVSEGDPTEEILRVAEMLHCDLIVMGSHGRTGLERFLTGSVAEGVLRRARCPVMVVKTPARATPVHESQETAKSGEVVDVRSSATPLLSAHTRTLLLTPTLKLVRLSVPAGQHIPQDQGKGEIIVHCLEGRVDVTALGKTQTLKAGQLLQLPAREPHEFRGIDDASLLLTILPAGR
jgi:nucleotide-binding universal stress UspA family protein/quercetin dioxygenase-like cupin family protein